jgi:hypothetical protein
VAQEAGMNHYDDEAEGNEWMRAYLDGEDPPKYDLPYFFLTGHPFDSPVWMENAVLTAIGIPTNASYFTIGTSAADHILERRGSSGETQRLLRMAEVILARPLYVQRYDEETQKFAVVGRIAVEAPLVLVAGELRPSFTGRDELRLTTAYVISERTVRKRLAVNSLVPFEQLPSEYVEPEEGAT